jgi:hypothetical protein
MLLNESKAVHGSRSQDIATVKTWQNNWKKTGFDKTLY